MAKSARKARKVVKGPQLALAADLRTPKLDRTSGYEDPKRRRYIEPATKKDGQPFFALRVHAALLDAFKAHAKKKGVLATDLVRAYMSKVTGVEAEAASDGE